MADTGESMDISQPGKEEQVKAAIIEGDRGSNGLDLDVCIPKEGNEGLSMDVDEDILVEDNAAELGDCQKIEVPKDDPINQEHAFVKENGSHSISASERKPDVVSVDQESFRSRKRGLSEGYDRDGDSETHGSLLYVRPRLGHLNVKSLNERALSNSQPRLLSPRTASFHSEGQDKSLDLDPSGELFPLRGPRYDNDAYQAPIPDLVEERDHPMHAEDNATDSNFPEPRMPVGNVMVWGGSNMLRQRGISSAALDEYIFFCRRLTRNIPPQGSHFLTPPKSTKNDCYIFGDVEIEDEVFESDDWPTLEGRAQKIDSSQSAAVNSVSLRPSISDEQALQILHENNYNIIYTKFLLLSAHGAGVDSDALEARQRQQRSLEYEPAIPASSYSLSNGKTKERSYGNSWSSNGEFMRYLTAQPLSLRKWITVARAALAGRPIPTRRILLELVKILPIFQDAEKSDQRQQSTSQDLRLQLEDKLAMVDEWISNTHDAISLSKPDSHWKLDELKDLLSRVPSGVKLSEALCLKKFYDHVVKLQKQVQAALAEPSHIKTLTLLLDSVLKQPVKLVEQSRLQQRIETAKQIKAYVRFTLPCSEHWENGTYGYKKSRILSGFSALAKLGFDASESKNSGSITFYDRHRFDLRIRDGVRWIPHTLPQLEKLLERIKEEHILFDDIVFLEKYVQRALNWRNRLEKELSASTVDVKRSLAVLKELDTLPVDMRTERIPLDKKLQHVQSTIAKVKSALPRQSKTRGGVEAQKMEVDTLRILRDEAAAIGIKPEEVTEMDNLLARADQWKRKVESAFVDIEEVDMETLCTLLTEAGDIPVQMNQEDLLRAHIDCKRCCIDIKKALTNKYKMSHLIQLEAKFAQIKQRIVSLGGAIADRNPESSVPQISLVVQQNGFATISDYETAIKSAVDNCRAWILKAHSLCGSTFDPEAWDALDDEKLIESNKRTRKKRVSKPSISDGVFPPNERIHFSQFLAFYREAMDLPVNVRRERQMLLELDRNLNEQRTLMMEALKASSQPEYESLKNLTERLEADSATVYEKNQSSANKVKSGEVSSGGLSATDLDHHDVPERINETESSSCIAEAKIGSRHAFSYRYIEDLLNSCRANSVIVSAEEKLEAAFNRAKPWIKRSLAVCPFLLPWSDFTKVDSAESEHITIDSVAELIESHDELIVDVEDIVLGLRQVLEASKRFHERAMSIISKYYEAVSKMDDNSLKMPLSEWFPEFYSRVKPSSLVDENLLVKNGAETVLEPSSADDAVARSKREHKKRSFGASDGTPYQDAKRRNSVLGIHHTVAEETVWKNCEERLSEMVAKDFPLSMQETATIPIDYLDPSKFLSRFGRATLEEFAPSYGQGFDQIVQDSIAFVQDLKSSNSCTVVYNMEVAKSVEWIVEASAWIGAVSAIIMGRFPMTLAQLRDLIAEGFCVVHGSFVDDSKLSEYRGSLEALSDERFSKILSFASLNHLRWVKFGERATSMADVEKLSLTGEEILRDLTTSDFENTNLGPMGLGGNLIWLIRLLQYTGRHVQAWQESADSLLVKTKTMEQMMMLRVLLEEKMRFGLFPVVEAETAIISEFDKVHKWVVKMRGILCLSSTEDKPTIKEMEKLIAEASKLKCQPREVTKARGTIRRARNWLAAVKRTGIEKGEANRDDLTLLLHEAEEIPLDLSENTVVLSAATRLFCFCRRGFSDEMLECTHCRNWFHLRCIDFSGVVVNPSTRYCCPACLINRVTASIRGSARASIVRVRMAHKVLRDSILGGGSEGIGNDISRSQKLVQEPHLEILNRLYEWTEKCARFLDDNDDTSYLLSANTRNRFDTRKRQISEDQAAITIESTQKLLTEELDDITADSQLFQSSPDAQIILEALRYRLWCDSNPSACFQKDRAPSLSELEAVQRKNDSFSPSISQHLFSTYVSRIVAIAEEWTKRASRLIHSDVSVSQKYILQECTRLVDQARYLPVWLPLEKSLLACVEDSANRYCLCNGFNDGEFMINCDICDNWFHGRCVNLTQQVGDSIQAYTCPTCAKRKGVAYEFGQVDGMVIDG